MEAALFLIAPEKLNDLMQSAHERLDIEQWMCQPNLYLGTAWQSVHDVLNRYSPEPIPVLNYVIQAEHQLHSPLMLPEALRYNSISKVSTLYQALHLLEWDELKRRYQKYLLDQADVLSETDELSVGEFRLLYRDVVELYRLACLNNQLLFSLMQQKLPLQSLF